MVFCRGLGPSGPGRGSFAPRPSREWGLTQRRASGYLPSPDPRPTGFPMRDRKQILKNLEAIYRESYERAKAEELPGRMAELDNSYMRDQLFFEVLLDIRDLFAVAPAAESKKGSALEKLETLRRLTRLR